MFVDLPANVPVISACAEATKQGWRHARECLLDRGFRAASASQELEQLESDYWTANNLVHGESVEQAIPKGDQKEVVLVSAFGRDIDLETTKLDSPFLLVTAPEITSEEKGEVHQVFTRDDGSVAVLLDDRASTSMQVFFPFEWEDFDQLIDNLSDANVEILSAEAALQVSSDNFDEPSFLGKIVYSLFPSTFPDTPSWSVMQTDPERFADVLKRKSDFVFTANYTVTRLY